MQGLALNHELTRRRARLLKTISTAPDYRLYALPGGPPERPGLVRVATGGAAIEVEVWLVPVDQLGAFIAAIPSPLGIGQIRLSDGSQVCGFLCEAIGVAQARDITHLGSWRRYLATEMA